MNFKGNYGRQVRFSDGSAEKLTELLIDYEPWITSNLLQGSAGLWNSLEDVWDILYGPNSKEWCRRMSTGVSPKPANWLA